MAGPVHKCEKRHTVPKNVCDGVLPRLMSNVTLTIAFTSVLHNTCIPPMLTNVIFLGSVGQHKCNILLLISSSSSNFVQV